MSDVELDITEWKKYNKDLLYLIEETLPRECKKFMRREGGRLATASRRKARETVRKKTGNYFIYQGLSDRQKKQGVQHHEAGE